MSNPLVIRIFIFGLFIALLPSCMKSQRGIPLVLGKGFDNQLVRVVQADRVVYEDTLRVDNTTGKVEVGEVTSKENIQITVGNKEFYAIEFERRTVSIRASLELDLIPVPGSEQKMVQLHIVR